MKGAIPAHALDVGAFALGIALAVWNGWRTADLVWGLWLSSLVLGWLALALGALRSTPTEDADSTTILMTKLFFLGFFTVHFCGFHFVHSIFLSALFPFTVDEHGRTVGFLEYGKVFANYWPWLLVAAVAERDLLLGRTSIARTATTAGKGMSFRKLPLPGFDPFVAYKNVVRMHLLIFALLPMQIAGIGDSWSYALVYAVYFWPRRTRTPSAS